MTARTLTIGSATYPLVLPNIRDPRLHVASVIITVHVLGQVGLHFWVSVPQILAAILTCWVLEVAITFRQTKAFVWPASAMLTGSGVALILRVVGTPPDQPWSFAGVEIFAVVAGLSLLSKYVIRYRGSHIFNPSNIGLVVAFLVLGASRVEPLDFWWAPLTNPAMLLAYAVILAGGLLITRRLKLLALAAAYWLVLAAGLGVLAASGHSMVTRWSFAPVTGFDYWRAIVTSPEVLIFLFFMITDPKTVPAGRVGRVVFGALVGIVGVLFMAPQTDEWGTKVGLLSALVAVSAIRPLLERVVPAPGSPEDSLRWLVGRLVPGFRPEPAGGAIPAGGATPGAAQTPASGPTPVARATPTGGATPLRNASGIGVAALAIVVVGAGIVVAGTPARGAVVASSAEVLNRLPQQVDPATLPAVAVGQDVTDFYPELAGPGIQEVLVTLAQNLEYENQALVRRDPAILAAVNHGDRLTEMEARVAAAASREVVLEHYTFDTVKVGLIRPFGVQDGFSLGLDSTGTLVRESVGVDGSIVQREEVPFSTTFALRRATGDRWLTIAVLPPGAAMP